MLPGVPPEIMGGLGQSVKHCRNAIFNLKSFVFILNHYGTIMGLKTKPNVENYSIHNCTLCTLAQILVIFNCW